LAILVVEDEPGIVTFLRRGLDAAGYQMIHAPDGPSGLALAQREDVDLVVLDLGLPGLPGEELLVRLRELRANLPVIILTAKATVADKVANLEAGADDYLVKPFSFSELLARIRARLRSVSQSSASVLEVAGLRLDPSASSAPTPPSRPSGWKPTSSSPTAGPGSPSATSPGASPAVSPPSTWALPWPAAGPEVSGGEAGGRLGRDADDLRR
jgi:CheY-like chemotaxis protein